MYPKWIGASPTNLLPTGSTLRRFRFWQYSRLVRSTYRANLIQYLPVYETGGTVLSDLSGQGNNGALVAATVKQVGIGDGHQCPSFPANSIINLYSAGLASDFSPTAGSLMVWFKPQASTFWTNGAEHRIITLQADANNRILIYRGSATINRLDWLYTANGVVDSAVQVGLSSLDWQHVGFTWNKAGEIVRAYYNGSEIGTSATLGVWAGNLAATTTCLSDQSTSFGRSMVGFLSHWALWNTVLPAQTIKRLYRG